MKIAEKLKAKLLFEKDVSREKCQNFKLRKYFFTSDTILKLGDNKHRQTDT